MPVVGQEMIGMFRTSNSHYGRPDLAFPHGVVTEATEKGFKVKYEYLRGMEWSYKYSDLGRIVFETEDQADRNNAAKMDSMQEEGRLGVEE